MSTTATQRVAGTVRRALLNANISQTEAATALGLSQAAVSRRLCGHVPFDVTELHIVAQLLRVEPASLLDSAA